MRIRTLVMVGLGVGAVALALAGCTRVARGEGYGQGSRGARYAQSPESREPSARGYGRGQQAPSEVDAARGGLRSATEPGRGAAAGRAAIEPASGRTGRDVAGLGALRTLSGTLSSGGTEWYLDAADGRYLLHLGNTAYVEQIGLDLEVGEPAVVKGLVDADEVSVVSLEFRGRAYALRSEDGRPLWAGRGRGAGRGAGQGPGRGAGSGA